MAGSEFKQLTKKEYEALGPDEKLDYLAAAIQANSDALYVCDPQPPLPPESPKKTPRQ